MANFQWASFNLFQPNAACAHENRSMFTVKSKFTLSRIRCIWHIPRLGSMASICFHHRFLATRTVRHRFFSYQAQVREIQVWAAKASSKDVRCGMYSISVLGSPKIISVVYKSRRWVSADLALPVLIAIRQDGQQIKAVQGVPIAWHLQFFL